MAAVKSRIKVLQTTKAIGLGKRALDGTLSDYILENIEVASNRALKEIGDETVLWWKRNTPNYWTHSEGRDSSGQFADSLSYTVGKDDHALFFHMSPIYSNVVSKTSEDASLERRDADVGLKRRKLGKKPRMDIQHIDKAYIDGLKKLAFGGGGPVRPRKPSKSEKAYNAWIKADEALDKESIAGKLSRYTDKADSVSGKRKWEYGRIIRRGEGRVPKKYWQIFKNALERSIEVDARDIMKREIEEQVDWIINRGGAGGIDEKRITLAEVERFYDSGADISSKRGYFG